MSPVLRTLFVTWQEPESRRIYPIARLMGLASGAYEFAYIRAVVAAQSEGFRGLPGYEDVKEVYVSAELPGLFDNRLPVRGRHASPPDPSELMSDSLDAAPITILVPAGGGTNVRLEVFAPPLLTPEGAYAGVFWARGVGRIPGAEEVALALQPHERVSLSAEPDNAYNSRALRILRADHTPIGYVPDYLANELAAAGGDPNDVHVEVLRAVRASFPPAPPVYSILCKYTCGPGLGRALFYSESYEPLASRAFRRAPPGINPMR